MRRHRGAESTFRSRKALRYAHRSQPVCFPYTAYPCDRQLSLLPRHAAIRREHLLNVQFHGPADAEKCRLKEIEF